LRVQLRKAGWTRRWGCGSHEIWQDPGNRQRRVTLYGRNGDDAPRYQQARVGKFRKGMMVYEPD
jgi:hypothetical protein